MSPQDDEEIPAIYCNRCESSGVSAIVLCDNCPATCCIHLSGKVGLQLWCMRCIKKAGLDPSIAFRWFWITD